MESLNSPHHHAADRTKSRCGEVRFGNCAVYSRDSRPIGEGQFGNVYKGRDLGTNHDVAIKVFHDMRSSSGISRNTSSTGLHEGECGSTPIVSRSHYPSEIVILMKLRHVGCPNILFATSCWSQKRRTYAVVTEFCKGSDLRRYLEGRKRPVEENHARRLMYELANALFVLKSNHIIHRDIKPANLLLTSTDLHEAVLKVADFGMAKEATTQRRHELRDDDLEERDLETFLFASELGTPLYMSPERNQRQSYSFKADVYSAGLVLYELMVGRPVKAGSRSHLLTAVPDAIQQERAKYPVSQAPPWLSLVEGMTEPEPAHRLSVEQVLRHPWFAVAAVGPALPPLTIPLPATAEVTSGNGASPVVEALAPVGAGVVLTDVSDCDDGVETAEGKGEEDAPDARQASPLWRVLNTDGLQPPTASGPHIITSAVRNFVDVVVYYVYESEMDDQDALVLLGYLHDTVRHGLKLFEQELENVRASMHTPAPRPTSAAAVAVGTTADALPVAKSEPHSLPRAYPLTKSWKRLFRRLRALTGERRWLCESQGKPYQQLLDRSSSDSDEDPTATPPLSAEMLIFRRACKLIEADAVAELTQCSRERRGYAKATALLRVLLHQAVITVPDIGYEAAAASTLPPHTLCLVEVPTQRTSGGAASSVLNKLLAHLQASTVLV